MIGGFRVLQAYLDAINDRTATTMRDVTAHALRRHLRTATPAAVQPLPTTIFDSTETLLLADSFAADLAVSTLLGRAAIRSQVPAGELVTFNEPAILGYTLNDLLRLLTPQSALDYFRRLIPIRLGDALFGSLMTGQAFQLAATTDHTIRKAVSAVIEDRIATGKQVSAAGREIDAILDEANILHRGGYGEMVARTNMMESYRHGSWDEFNEPDVTTFFPVWLYSGVPDGRERQGPLPEKPDHHRWFGKYFDRAVNFWDVRGTEARDVINCRCLFIPINKKEWARRQAKGAVVTPWPQPTPIAVA